MIATNNLPYHYVLGHSPNIFLIFDLFNASSSDDLMSHNPIASKLYSNQSAKGGASINESFGCEQSLSSDGEATAPTR
jgi:hypothetical protein